MSFLKPMYEEIDANYTLEHTAAVTRHYWYVPLLASALYLLSVYLGTGYMSQRKAYSLRPLLIVWNILLASISITGAFVMAPDLYSYYMEKGFAYSVCNTAIHNKPMLSFWSLIFVLSKIFEFGDTFFIVVRKTPLMFLHWYHHVTVCIFSWYSLQIKAGPAHWYCAMNFSVHSAMYTYYILKAFGIRIPSFLAQMVTLLQLVQFVIGLLITVVASNEYWGGHACHVDDYVLFLGLSIYGSYLILFGRFFFIRYLKKKPPQKID